LAKSNWNEKLTITLVKYKEYNIHKIEFLEENYRNDIIEIKPREQ
jgi:hypothetical protein